MVSGKHINSTEDRAVMHIALRADRKDKYEVDGKNVVDDVWKVLDRIKTFSDKTRKGDFKNFLAIGIGGSYLGAEFVYESLKTDNVCSKAADGKTLKFLANVDPISFRRATMNMKPAETLIIVISKTFTTRETMLNAALAKQWLIDSLGDKADVIGKHIVACSANVKGAKEFGIKEENVFPFWNWVGGRYSVCASVGVLPLSLVYGFDQVEQFLKGCRSIDKLYASADLDKNLPVILALIGLWNSTFLKFPVRGIIPYCEALLRFPAHVQQLDMESNGKGVSIDGKRLTGPAGEIILGEPGTNAQH
eukprot:UN25415